ncbi:PH domain-containing protein [Marmoricola sp. RAF53]|uniref:PH domain-containing protein n=1 Tax=Marmoricola sp. RAF53 TaxID=3233059 RepID=UPI003F9C6DB7
MAINPKYLNPGEQVVWSTRTHVKALVMPVLVLLVTVGFAGYLSSLPDDNKPTWFGIIWGVTILVNIIWGLIPFLNWFGSTYTVTDRRLTTHKGVLTRSGHDIPLTRISDVSYQKGVLDRILGCGTLIVSDASEQGRVELPDVPNVEKRQLALSDLLFHGSKADDGS